MLLEGWGGRSVPVRRPPVKASPLGGVGGGMTEHGVPSASVDRWYSRPVFFVADPDRALRFYIDQLGFEKNWHAGDGRGRGLPG